MRCSELCAAANSGLWRSVTGRGSHPTGSVTGCAAHHEARHSPRLRLAPSCSEPRPRPGVAELGVVRRPYAHSGSRCMKLSLWMHFTSVLIASVAAAVFLWRFSLIIRGMYGNSPLDPLAQFVYSH